jgi:AraC-like DNA-binding protein
MKHLMGADFFTADLPLSVHEARHGAITPHQHEFFELVYVLSGSGVHCIGTTNYPIHAGDVYVISPDEPHAYHPVDGSELRIINVLFMPGILDESMLNSPALAGLTEFLYIEPLFREEAQFAHRLNLQGSAAYRIETLLWDMEQEQKAAAAGYNIVLRNMFCTLLVLMSRAYTQHLTQPDLKSEWRRRHRVVEAALHYIEAHHTEALSLDEVARHTAMSPSRLAHLFKEHTRRSILAYLHEYRIGRVCADLLRTDRPISELALEMGYGDLAFFNRLFRRYMACSPSEYRRRFRLVPPTAPDQTRNTGHTVVHDGSPAG